MKKVSIKRKDLKAIKIKTIKSIALNENLNTSPDEIAALIKKAI